MRSSARIDELAFSPVAAGAGAAPEAPRLIAGAGVVRRAASPHEMRSRDYAYTVRTLTGSPGPDTP